MQRNAPSSPFVPLVKCVRRPWFGPFFISSASLHGFLKGSSVIHSWVKHIILLEYYAQFWLLLFCFETCFPCSRLREKASPSGSKTLFVARVGEGTKRRTCDAFVTLQNPQRRICLRMKSWNPRSETLQSSRLTWYAWVPPLLPH